MLQYKAIQNGEKLDGEIINNLINPDDVTEYFSARLNEIFSNLEDNNYSNTDEYYNELMGIATQCPYYGGEAVYRARAVLELIHDSLTYNDDATCLLYGIYRQGILTEKNSDDLKISVKPNPTNHYVSIKGSSLKNSSLDVTFLNAIGQKVYNNTLYCNKENLIRLEQLSQGIYTIVIKTTVRTEYFKLVIVR
jgi:hypothetical protein